MSLMPFSACTCRYRLEGVWQLVSYGFATEWRCGGLVCCREWGRERLGSLARYPCRFICARPIAWDLRLPSAMVGTDSMSEVSETAVRPRMAVSMVCAKSGESIALAMFSDPRDRKSVV